MSKKKTDLSSPATSDLQKGTPSASSSIEIQAILSKLSKLDALPATVDVLGKSVKNLRKEIQVLSKEFQDFKNQTTNALNDIRQERDQDRTYQDMRFKHLREELHDVMQMQSGSGRELSAGKRSVRPLRRTPPSGMASPGIQDWRLLIYED
ncbi:MAG: hypothetical protein H7838_08915 [Magnetococcus sp. DMHC-8]